MDAVLLDTDVFSYLMRPGDTRAGLYPPLVANKTIALSFASVGELFAWPVRRSWGPKKTEALEARLKEAVILPYDLELCRVFGRVKANLEMSGRTIATSDLWIAASGIRHAMPLVSHNRRHFEDIPGLQLIGEAPQ